MERRYGGTYEMSNEAGAACAVFKPADEEPYVPLNPKARRAAPRARIAESPPPPPHHHHHPCCPSLAISIAPSLDLTVHPYLRGL